MLHNRINSADNDSSATKLPAWVADLDAKYAAYQSARSAAEHFNPPIGAVSSIEPLDSRTPAGQAFRAVTTARDVWVRACRELIDDGTSALAKQHGEELSTAQKAIETAIMHRSNALAGGASDADIDALDAKIKSTQRSFERIKAIPAGSASSKEHAERRVIFWSRFWRQWLAAQAELRTLLAAAIAKRAEIQMMIGDAELIFDSLAGAVAWPTENLIDELAVDTFARDCETVIAAGSRLQPKACA